MNDVSKKMNFQVYTDLKNPRDLYTVEIELEKEVDSYAREAAISLAGAIIRNNFKRVYDKVMDSKELANFIQDKLNNWVHSQTNFIAKKVVVAPALKKAKV